jgi:hypothetical protein
MSEDDTKPSDTGTKTLDYIALGLLLAPPAVVVEMAIKGDNIDWRKTVIATAVCWILGGVFVWASHRWKSWRSAIPKAMPYLAAAENKFWVKGAIVAAAMGGALALSSILSNGPQSTTTNVENDKSQKQISDAQDAARKAIAAKETAEHILDSANQQIGTLQSQLNQAVRTSDPIAVASLPTHLRLQFTSVLSRPVEIDSANVHWTLESFTRRLAKYCQNNVCITVGVPQNDKNDYDENIVIITLIFDKPIAYHNVQFNSNEFPVGVDVKD